MDYMENIMQAVVLFGAFVGAVIYLRVTTKSAIKDVNKEDFKDVNDSIESMKNDMNARFDDVNKRIEKSDLQACRNFLVHAMVDIERGIADDALIHRFWDELDYYHKKNQNSYIDTRVQALIDAGKLKPRLK